MPEKKVCCVGAMMFTGLWMLVSCSASPAAPAGVPVMPPPDQTATRLTPAVVPPTSLPPTQTRTAIPSSTPAPSPTPPPMLNLIIAACDTGTDFFNSLGEVTNAYLTVQNTGGSQADDLVVVLEASDEEKIHPDKTSHIQHLPPGSEISIKLTVDTAGNTPTSITAKVTAAGGLAETAMRESCKARRPDKDILSALGELNTVRKITTR